MVRNQAAQPGSSALLPGPVAESPNSVSRRWRRAVLALLVLAAPLVLVVLRSQPVALRGKPSEATGLSNRACKEYPYLKIKPPVLYSNLAGRGPDHDHGEGLVYDTIDLGKAAGSEWNREVLITINATNYENYHPFASKLNGIQGKYASINMMSGSSLEVVFHFYDKETRKQLTLAEAALTFFDLDTGKDGKSTESITLGGYKHYHVTENTEVVIEPTGDGRTKFSGSTFGVGEDNPVDPMSMTDQQRNRAVSLTFDNLSELFVTMAAGQGGSPRFFTFIIRPSLMCGVVVRDPFGSKLPDLNAVAPLQVAIEAGEEEQMEGFLVFAGTAVKKGDRLAVTLDGNGRLKTYTSPIDGTIKSVQHELISGDELDMKLNNKTIVVIERKVLDPLPPAGPGELPAGPGSSGDVDPAATLVKYLLDVNDTVSQGDPIAELTYKGNTFFVRSQVSGVIASRQDALRAGDPIMLVRDKNLMNVGKFPALPQPDDSTSRRSAFFGKNQRLKRFKKKVGDTVKKGEVIAIVEDTETGVDMEIQSLHGGIITDMQDQLKEGDDLNRVADKNLAMVGKLAPLEEADDNEETWRTPFGKGDHKTFVGYAVKEGDIVRAGQTVAFAKNQAGQEVPIKATKPGVVGALHHDLEEGMDLDEVLAHDNIASLHKLKPLVIQIGEEGSFVPADGNWELVDWKVKKGDTIGKGATIAILKDARTGKEALVTAGKGGTISELQNELKPGDLVQEVVPDGNLAVIGKFPMPYVGWPMQVPIRVPSTKVIFNKWLAKEGDLVEAGQPVAEVTTVGRRLVAAPVPAGVPCGPLGKPVKVLAPAAGTVVRPLDLRPGMAIEDQALSDVVGVVDMWPPWWLMIIATLIVLWLLTFCLHKVMGKPKRSSYTAVGRNSNNERQPNFNRGASGRPSGGMLMARANSNRSVGSLGRTCRLDFDDEIGNTRTVQASYRPLGFRHHNEAPISVREFTVNSYGKWELGLQKGWKLTRIGDDVIEENDDFSLVNDKLENAMKDLPVWPLPLEFMIDAETGDRKVIMFRERPIGLEFKNTRPIQVGQIYPGSPAEREGVEVGWIITRIGEFQVTAHHTMHTVMATLKEGTQFLDDTGEEDYE